MKDNPTSNLDGMVGEAFIKPPQESDINGGLDAVRPVLLREEGVELVVKVVHGIVIAVDLGGSFGIAGEHNIFRTVAEGHGNLAHLGEVAAHLGR